MYKHKYSLVACARWEENDIVEWIEYHKSIGFDHIYLYSNDDDPTILYKRVLPYLMGENPYITYTYWETPGAQISMYLHFLGNYSSETEWASFLDIDEFLVLKNIDNIKNFMAEFEDICDCLYFNWVPYGNNGKLRRDNDSILLTRTKRASGPDPHTKHIFRTAKLTEEKARQGITETGYSLVHFLNDYPIDGLRILNVLGVSVDGYATDFPVNAIPIVRAEGVPQAILDKGYVAHFQFKSEEDFVRRASRGGFAAQEMWRGRYEDGSFKNILENHNYVEDFYLRDYWRAKVGKLINYGE
ncbi:glycosyltransferase family 92 protein [Asticcacaulis taihuensis]|uniref:glycosyltransferase family 92 protein n=1 Tax=Asticcacaulis taihuensis TaxID=260084 RepID=UPI003F7BE381